MPTFSDILGVPIALPTDVAKQFPAAVDDPRTSALERYTIPRFTDAATRDAKIPTPDAGMVCYVAAWRMYMLYDGAVWTYLAGLAPSASLHFTVTPLSVTAGSRLSPAASGTTSDSWTGMGGSVDITNALVDVPIPGLYRVRATMNADPGTPLSCGPGGGSDVGLHSMEQLYTGDVAAPYSIVISHTYETEAGADTSKFGFWWATSSSLPVYGCDLEVSLIGTNLT